MLPFKAVSLSNNNTSTEIHTLRSIRCSLFCDIYTRPLIRESLAEVKTSRHFSSRTHNIAPTNGNVYSFERSTLFTSSYFVICDSQRQNFSSSAVMAGKMEDTGKRRSRCFGLPLFIFNLSGMLLFFMVGTVYTAAVIRTIERRFGLRSSQTGLLFSCNEISNTALVLVIGFFGRRAHKPRVIAVTILFSVIANLMMALPHWVFSLSSLNISSTSHNGTGSGAGGTSATAIQFCPSSAFNRTTSNTSGCDTVTNDAASTNDPELNGLHSAYYIFVVAQLLSGIGSSGLVTLGLTYIDENAPKSKSSMFIGIVTSMFAIGPLCAFGIAAFALRLPEDLFTSTSLKPEDPAFIGCWWLGYLICAVVLFILAIPMWFFPRSFNPKGDTPQVSRPTESKGIKGQLKELPRSVGLLLRNKIYLINIGCAVCAPFIIMGVNANIVRHVEVHFLERAFVAGIIAALAAALPGAIGSFAGGLLMSKMRMTPTGAVRVMIIASACFAAGLLGIILLSCPQVSMAGRIDPEQNTLNVLNNCNQHCGCQSDRNSFVPVCGSDNLTYFSACFAGCTRVVNETNMGCGCLSTSAQIPANHASLDQFEFSGTARPGFCESRCSLLIPFAIVLFLMCLFGYMSMVPLTMVNLRVVEGDERSFALAVCAFIVNIAGFVAPLLFGRLIDSSCLMWQRTAALPTASSSCDRYPPGASSSGETGNCLLYDTTKFRERVFGVSLGFKLIDLMFAIILFVFIRKIVFNHDDDDAAHGDALMNGTVDVNANIDVEESQLLNGRHQHDTDFSDITPSGAN